MTRALYSHAYERLRQLLRDGRRARGLTQAELAGRLGRPQSFVSKYEQGERRLDLVEFLEVADSVGVDPCEVIDVIRREVSPDR